MRYPSGDLAILSAESYNDGIQNLASKKAKKAAVAIVAGDAEEGLARKRRKRTAPHGGADEDERKRSRGRPRLEPKDETAQDRRRTQIRLAQRAYRNRKENAIQSLERRVQELMDTNEEMNNAFLKLHDFAVDRGLLDRMPEIGHQLRETTQKFLSLARRYAEDAPNEDDRSVSRESDSQPTERSRKSNSPEMVERPGRDGRSRSPNAQPQLYGGLMVTQEPVTLRDLDMPSSSAISHTPTHVPAAPPPDYEVITYPTLDNASFPFGFGPSDFSFNTTPEQLTTPSSPPLPADFSDLNSHSSSLLYPSLPLPNSFAAQEVTFGRRFQRTALERAWTLVTMANPPQKRLARVFGFCLLFEPMESIRARLKRGLDRTSGESLNNWQYPFLQLGGAGTHHFGDAATGGVLVGNQGTADVLRPRNANGYGMGPYDAKVYAARDLLEGNNDYLPYDAHGLGGEYFDCDEIEMYLHQRNVAIPPAADYVTVEIDADAFTEGEGGGGRQTAGRSDAFGGNSITAAFDINRQQSFGPLDAVVTGQSSSGSASSNSRSLVGALSPGAESGEDTSITVASEYAHADLWTFDGREGLAAAAAKKKRVTVDVNLLILEMVERAICLGRTPGLRKEDINGAFWVATKHGL